MRQIFHAHIDLVEVVQALYHQAIWRVLEAFKASHVHHQGKKLIWKLICLKINLIISSMLIWMFWSIRNQMKRNILNFL